MSTNQKQFDNTNRGVLFRDANKEEGSKKPDFTGKIDVGGKEYRLAAWTNVSRSGQKFLSLSVSEFKPKTEDKEPY